MSCHICIKVDVKEDFYQSQETVTLRLKPPPDLLHQLETYVETNSVSLKLEGNTLIVCFIICLFVCLLICLFVCFVGEEVWRVELYTSIFVNNFSAKLSGKWIEIILRKEKSAHWPSLKVSYIN